MAYNFDFDICACVMCAVMLFIFYLKKCIPSLQSRLFGMMLWFCLAAAIGDLGDGLITMYGGGISKSIHAIFIYIYYISINALPVLYALYGVSLTETQGNMLKGFRGWLFYIPIGVSVLLVVMNPFVHSLFYFDEYFNYNRGFGFILMNITAFYFMILGVLYVWLNRQIVARSKRIAMYSFLFFTAIPVSIQLLIPSLYVTTFGVALCLFLLFMTIQNQEELMSETGLLNRKALLSVASIYYRRKEQFAVISLQVNDYRYFKRVFGSRTMMGFLGSIAEMLKYMYIKGKETYYVGSGRFVLLIPESEMKPDLAERVIKLFDSEIKTKRINAKFTAGACVIFCPQDAEDVDCMMEYVDSFEVSGETRQSVSYAAQIQIAGAGKAKEMEQAVERALTGGGLRVYYQPIYSVEKHCVNSAEALVRLQDDSMGLIMPNDFIPISERNGAIIRIGMAVFRSVCEFYITNGLKEKGIEYIEINLSVAQCMQKKLAEQLLTVMKEYNIEPQCINLEITESVAVTSPEILEGVMNTLTEEGIHFSMDDYGTGFSNMISLVELPFSLVKIDKEMIAKLDKKRTQIAVSNTITMLKNLSFEIVAEGVETAEQVELLIQMGCDYLQGYYFSRPVPGEQFLLQTKRINEEFAL